MARKQPLEEVLRKVRLEARRAANPSLSESEKDKLVHLVNRVQRSLYLEHYWPFLQKREPVAMSAGQRFYDIPAGYDLERIETVFYKDTTVYCRLPRGIDMHHYNTHDSFTGERADPPMRWDIVDNGGDAQLEIWPIPDTGNYSLVIQGLRAISPLVNDGDLVELDDYMIALYCAAELLTNVDKEDAKVKLVRANELRDKLIASAEVAAEPIVVSGGDPYRHHRRPADIRYAPRG